MLTPRDLEMFARVNSNTPDLAAWIKAKRHEWDTRLVNSANPAITGWAQGRVQMLDELLELLEESSKTITNLRNRS